MSSDALPLVSKAPARALEPWRAMLAGLCASLVGLGLARFAYTPLLPAIVEARWFGAADASWLAAANLAGYLAGALLAAPLSARASARSVLRGMMLLSTLTLLACAWPIDFAWFFAWRFLAGVGGGTLMVLAAPTILPHVAPARRGLASGAIFMGIGLGIAASGSLVPLLLRHGLTATWLGLGAMSLALTVLAWSGWPEPDAPAPAKRGHADHRLPAAALRAVYVEYALNAVGLVPHMIYLVDFVARGLGQGLAAGAHMWVLFGLGAVVGPIAGGLVADRTGFRTALRLAFVLQAIAAWLPAFGMTGAWLAISSVVMGAFTPGIVGLVLGRLHELLVHHPASHKLAWSRATTGFAILQAAAAYGMSYLLVRSGGHHAPLFAVGGAAVVLALAIDLVAPRLIRQPA
ncbi:YbfB/YjiJ family MFS transporter [Scleromatobacter humisilvae]|uniref:MFS transporter n=1 Tax=Scleromatobacter humisilvae TaxID=2897159 RepID=A0A9X2C1S6_9BURK|nr:YbfB/YjiJ family MFS transporter [Scleromatobacter humisilvae]MCK9685310.1 MFS transporter [Scleromatobacter humisilvae]